MIIRILPLVFAICLSSFCLAHEEPAKTLKEKKEKEENRQKIIKNKITKIIMWKHAVIEGKFDAENKEKFIESNYDSKGNIVEMNVFKSGDSLDYKVVFAFDQNNNMLTDTDYEPDGSIYEQIKYVVDNEGRVAEQTNYTKEGEIDSKFTYKIDYNRNILLFEKYKPLDSVEYQMVYKYDGNPDEGNNTEIIKQTTSGKQIMRVENVFNGKNQRTEKKIYDAENKLMYYFEYSYDNDGNNTLIEKKSTENKTLSKTVFKYNDKELVISIEGFDENNQLISFVSYKYP